MFDRTKTKRATPDGILVRLKDKLCIKLGIDSHALRMLIDRHIKETGGVGSSGSKMTKANTYSELCRDKMSIKVFFKFLNVIRSARVTIKITVETEHGKVVEVEDTVRFISPREDA